MTPRDNIAASQVMSAPPVGVSPGADVGVAFPRPLPKRKPLTVGQRLKRDWVMLALAAPGILFFVIFYYVECLGYVIAFQNYLPFLGFTKSQFVGLANFQSMFLDASFWQSVQNTIIISVLQLLLYFPAPIGLALLINSIISSKWRRFIQSIVYLPHFIGWVIIVSLFQQLLGGTGVFNHFMSALGVQGVNVMASPPLFKWLVTFQVIWKDTGWGTIIYLAALIGIDAALYEAAAVDGANRWRRMWHVTLPGIVPITILLLILRLGQLLNVGFEQILLQRDAVGPKAGEIIQTWVYYHGIVGGQWGVTAAAGLLNGILGAAMVIGCNKVAHLFGQEGLYSNG